MSSRPNGWIPLLAVVLLQIKRGNASGCTLLNPASVMFALDSSASVGHHYYQGLHFVKNISEQFNNVIGTLFSKGLIVFGTNAQISIPLNQYSAKEFADRLKKVAPMGGLTQYEKALKLCQSEFLRYNPANVTRLMVFITDGAPSNQYLAVQWVKSLKQTLNADFIFVGIGSIHQSIVDQLAGKKNQFFANNHDDLNKLVNALAIRICKLSGGISTVCAVTLALFVVLTLIGIPFAVFLGFMMFRAFKRRSDALKRLENARKDSQRYKRKSNFEYDANSFAMRPGWDFLSDDVSHLPDGGHLRQSKKSESFRPPIAKKSQQPAVRQKQRATTVKSAKPERATTSKSKSTASQVYRPGAASMFEGFQDDR